MKVVAFNASPRKKQGFTDRILHYVLDGMREAKAEVELVYLAEKNIHYCRGCWTCMLLTPGVCVQRDDMTEILIKVREADMVVLGTPVYVDGMTAQMKTLLDRSLPIMEPFFELRGGHCRHPPRDEKRRKMLVVSTCGFHEMDNFEPMLAHFKAAAKNANMEYIGAIIRPAGLMLDIAERMFPDKVQAIYAAMKRAGYEAVARGRISPQALKAAAQKIVPRELYIGGVNAEIRRRIREKHRIK